MRTPAELHDAIANVCPIDGISVVDPSHKETWRIDYSSAATDQQRLAASAVVTAFDFNADPVPEEISDRQFFQQLAAVGVITQSEALAAVGPGEIPQSIAAVISSMPEAQRFSASMLFSGATVFKRSHPLVPVFAAALAWSPADTDNFWVAASVL